MMQDELDNIQNKLSIKNSRNASMKALVTSSTRRTVRKSNPKMFKTLQKIQGSKMKRPASMEPQKTVILSKFEEFPSPNFDLANWKCENEIAFQDFRSERI